MCRDGPIVCEQAWRQSSGRKHHWCSGWRRCIHHTSLCRRCHLHCTRLSREEPRRSANRGMCLRAWIDICKGVWHPVGYDCIRSQAIDLTSLLCVVTMILTSTVFQVHELLGGCRNSILRTLFGGGDAPPLQKSTSRKILDALRISYVCLFGFQFSYSHWYQCNVCCG